MRNILFGRKRDYITAKNTTPSYYVYILECLDGSYYTGYTQDLGKRITQHKMGNGSVYTKDKGFKRLVYFEAHSSEEQAKKREFYIKKAGRIYREIIINEFQQNIKFFE